MSKLKMQQIFDSHSVDQSRPKPSPMEDQMECAENQQDNDRITASARSHGEYQGIEQPQQRQPGRGVDGQRAVNSPKMDLDDPVHQYSEWKWECSWNTGGR